MPGTVTAMYSIVDLAGPWFAPLSALRHKHGPLSQEGSVHGNRRGKGARRGELHVGVDVAPAQLPGLDQPHVRYLATLQSKTLTLTPHKV